MGDVRASPAGVGPEASEELVDSFEGYISLFFLGEFIYNQV
jgi:hypothetical protein